MYNSTYFTSESSCSASFRDIGPWNHSSRESIWCFIEWSAPIDDIEILCTWSPILIVCWFDKFECVSIADCTLEVTKPKTPPPGALVAKGPKKIEMYFPTIGILHNLTRNWFRKVWNMHYTHVKWVSMTARRCGCPMHLITWSVNMMRCRVWSSWINNVTIDVFRTRLSQSTRMTSSSEISNTNLICNVLWSSKKYS